MLSRRHLVLLALASSAALAQQPAVPALTLKVVTDRTDAIFEAGDTVSFLIESADENSFRA